jgi:predicted aspartyl protease
MEIAGEWWLCDDGFTRPVVHIMVHGLDQIYKENHFLIDTGADRTVFNAELLEKLKLSSTEPPAQETLVGVGGSNRFVLVRTVLELTTIDGGSARVRGEFAEFTDPSAIDLSVIGRDILDLFDVILSRRRNEVRLLGTNHTYRVSSHS